MTRLADHKALVMGASSPVGIGAAIAEALAGAGAEVVISARREAPLAVLGVQLTCWSPRPLNRLGKNAGRLFQMMEMDFF